MSYIEEEWKPVFGYEGLYEVSSCGSVRRSPECSGPTAGRMLKPHIMKTGYAQIGLVKNKNRQVLYVHAMVAEAFIGPRPVEHVVNHLDANRSNNHVMNLEFVTQRGNVHYCVAMGRMRYGETHGQAVLKEVEVLEIRTIGSSMSKRAIARRFGVSPATVAHIQKRVTWRHL